MALAHPTLQQEAGEAIACDYFVDAMDDADFVLKVRERAPPTLDEALRVALQLEAWTKDARQLSDDGYRKPKVRGAVDDTVRLAERLANRLESDLNKRLDAILRLHEAPLARLEVSVHADCKVSDAARSNDAKQQSSRQDESKAAWPRKEQGSQRSPTVCWRCGQPGHVQRNSRLPAPDKELPGAVNRGSRGLDRANVYVWMQLADKSLPCLLDSGCEVTLILETVVEAARNLEVLPSSQQLWSANRTEIDICGEATFLLMLDGKCIWTTAFVSPDVEAVMMGSDWLQDHNCVWEFGRSRVFIDSTVEPL